jgi:hypothetical protein
LNEIDSKIHDIHKQISKLNTELGKLTKSHIDLLTNGNKNSNAPNSINGVASIELRPLIQEWIDKGNSLVELGRHSELHESTIRYILNGRTKFTSAINADKILVALNATHVRLTEIPNPYSRQVTKTDDCE